MLHFFVSLQDKPETIITNDKKQQIAIEFDISQGQDSYYNDLG